MNSRQLEYAVLLSQVRNFSQVAEELDISQPALSKQILNLETELGLKLFDRDHTPLTLTPAGEFFVQEARDLLYREQQLLQTMQRYKTGEEGRLSIGISPFRSMYLMPEIVKQVKSKYPGVQVVLRESGSDQLRKDAMEGKVDFAIVNLPVEQSVLDVVPIEPDVLVLAVPAEMVPLIPSAPAIGGQVREVDFRDCGKLPFVVVGKNQEMRRLFDKLCAAADFHPHITAEVVGLSTAWSMAHAGVGATLIPLQFVQGTRFEKDLALFTIKENAYSRQPVIVTRRGQYISEYAQYAIELLSRRAQTTD